MEKLDVVTSDMADVDATLFTLSGAVDVFSYKDLKTAFDRWAKELPRKHALIDMTAVSYVGSSGWSVLFLQSSNQEAKGGALVLFGMTERVSRSLDIIMPRKRHISSANDLTSAVESLKEAPKGAEA